MKLEGDEYIQRMESDEEAVKIVTIHKSKGLEYNIVLAPFLDFKIDRKKHAFINYRDPETREYITIEKTKIRRKAIGNCRSAGRTGISQIIICFHYKGGVSMLLFLKALIIKHSTITTFPMN